METDTITPTCIELGAGSCGKVRLGYMQGTNVAIKEFTTQQLCDQEHAVISSLYHPHIIQFYGVLSTVYCVYCLAMEYANGSLYDYLSSSMEIPWALRWHWAKELASAVTYLHQKGIIHRDLKSTNCLIVRGVLKVCDFETATRCPLEPEREYAGTLCWKAPECIAKPRQFSKASDVYAMGMVIWEIATRKIPFSEAPFYTNETQLAREILHNNARPNLPLDWSQGIRDFFTKCWEASPTDRPSASETLEKLVNTIERFGFKKPEVLPPVRVYDACNLINQLVILVLTPCSDIAKANMGDCCFESNAGFCAAKMQSGRRTSFLSFPCIIAFLAFFSLVLSLPSLSILTVLVFICFLSYVAFLLFLSFLALLLFRSALHHATAKSNVSIFYERS